MKALCIGLLCVFLPMTSFGQAKYEELIAQADSMIDGNPEVSKELLETILSADSLEVPLQVRIKAYQLQALTEMYNYQFDQSTRLFEKSFRLLNYLQDDQERAKLEGYLLFDIGRNLTWQSKYDTALSVMLRARDIFDQLDDNPGMAQAFNSVAVIYIHYSNDPVKAKESFMNALAIHTTMKDTAGMGRVMQNIGQIYNMTGVNDSALYYLRMSNEFVRQANDLRSLAIGLNILGAVHRDIGRLDSSIYYYQKAIEMDQVNQDSIGLIYDYNEIAKTYLEAERYGEAKSYALLAHDNTKDLFVKQESSNVLSNVFEVLNNHQSALLYFKAFKALTDSIRSENQEKSIAELQTKYETLEKEKEIEEANAKLRTERNFRMFLTILVVVIAVFSLIAIVLLLQRFKYKRKLLSEEINNLRLQINLAFGGDINELDLTLDQINNGLINPLSDREFEILKHALSDKSNREVADKVFISVSTVKFHLRNIYEKLGVSNRKEALEKIFQKTK